MYVDTRGTPRFAYLAAALAFVSLGCQDNPGLEQTDTIRGAIVGTPASILAEATRSGVRWSLPGSFVFRTVAGEAIAVVARNYEFTGDYLAVDGIAAESETSSFILKGDGQNIYGSLVLPERNLAFEYTTSADGKVVVQQVPIEKIYPVCNDEPSLAALAGEPPHVGDYDGSDTNKLQSRPGATKVLFMDVSVLTLPKADLWRAWQIVSGAYSAFEVNVTTDAAVYTAAEARNRGKACISDEDGRSTCVVNAFGTSRCCTVYNKGSGYYQGNTTAHELGHLMGLDHDGSSSTEYFGGFSSFRWVPMMGDSTPKTSWGAQALFQWSKGEYSGANNTEDDLAIITRNLPYREDDVPDSKALVIASGGQVSSVDNRGQIARNTDSDTFRFTIGSSGGRAMLVIDRIEVIGGAYLDVDAEIQNGSGTRVVQSNDSAARTAKFDVSLPAGEYSLIIKGGAEGTPQNGFSNYSSLGFYGITGTITGAVVDGTGGRGGAGGTSGSGGSARERRHDRVGGPRWIERHRRARRFERRGRRHRNSGHDRRWRDDGIGRSRRDDRRGRDDGRRGRDGNRRSGWRGRGGDEWKRRCRGRRRTGRRRQRRFWRIWTGRNRRRRGAPRRRGSGRGWSHRRRRNRWQRRERRFDRASPADRRDDRAGSRPDRRRLRVRRWRARPERPPARPGHRPPRPRLLPSPSETRTLPGPRRRWRRARPRTRRRS